MRHQRGQDPVLDEVRAFVLKRDALERKLMRD
jgi:hypothetical protein